MSLSSILTGGLSKIMDSGGALVDRFVHSKDEQATFKLEMEALLQKAGSELEETMRTELQTKERIMVAELTQGDTFTKRARPMVVYVGLAVIVWNYSIVPTVAGFMQISLPAMTLPMEFWAGWSGIVMTWSVGRSMERRGVKNNLMTIINGKSPSLID